MDFKFAHTLDVLLLFLIPIGGGIPAGVLLAQKYGIGCTTMGILYFLSDLILACVFEPLMLLFIHQSRNSFWLAKLKTALAFSMHKTVSKFGLHPSPFNLILITFGTDPMTGRVVARAAGHRFFSGWMLVFIGDMFFFAVIMFSTLFLNNILGDGTLAALVVMVLMLVIPALTRRMRSWRNKALAQTLENQGK